MFAFFKGKKIYLLAMIFILSLTFGIVGCTDKDSKPQNKASMDSKNKLPMKYAVESPQIGALVTDRCEINGWAVSSKGIKKVEILDKDGSSLAEADFGLSRPDVARKFPQYPEAQNSGFDYVLDFTDLPNGEKNFKVKITDNNGEVKIAEIKINVDKPKRLEDHFDFPDGPNDPKVKQTIDKARQIVNDVIKPGMSDFQKVRAIHDYIITHAQFDQENWDKGNLPDTDYDPYGVLIQGKGVGTGYAEAMALLLDVAGIDNIIVHGETNGNGSWVTNTWNLVKVNGKYYHVNVNWDDPNANPDNKVFYDYFLRTDRQMSRDHRWDRNDYPESSTTNIRPPRLNNALVLLKRGLLVLFGTGK